MSEIANVVTPIFALIIFGYLAVRFKFFPIAGVNSLISFVNNFATPCLLFYSINSSDFGSAFNIKIIAPFYIAAITCFVLGSFAARKYFKSSPGESVSIGFSGTFTNTVLIGLPIMTRAYGVEALPVTLSIIGLHGAILLTVGMMVMELLRRDGKPLDQTLIVATRRIASNPLIWGIIAGVLGSLSGLELNEPTDAFFSMMASSVVPVSLFGIGGALTQFKLTENWKQAVFATWFKLVLHPALAYVMMIWCLNVPLETARYGVLLAAMPAGVNVYIFASYYDRAAGVAASSILLGTIISPITMSLWLYLLRV
ncbi:AEC family transporter [Brucella sp. BE17]|uniref:AEC family transporter n=1 Tax=Brucella sp. BE17 TaxID=3142977 RepID=UPI0031BA4C2A